MPSDLTLARDCSTTPDNLTRTLVQQERLRALGQMASGLAHDLNNSLTPIIGYTDFLLETQSGLSEEYKKYMHCIREAAADIARMVERMREFYRRRESCEPFAPVDLNELAKDVVERTRPDWAELPTKHGLVIKVETQLTKNLPEILGNESELCKAAGQLVLNAVDALPEGGTITVSTSFGACQSNGETDVVFEVRDDGVGMDEAIQQRCLEPFFSTKGPRGSGLGLAIVYGTVRRHEGAIEIRSAPGRGATVRLTFKGRPRRVAPEPAVPPQAEIAPLRILCIDDDHRISTMLREVLSSENHTVEVADGGEKGVDAFRKALQGGRPFHVVITDLGMPNVDGRQIVQTVKRESPSTPVIMLTGWAAMMDQEGELPSGVDAVVTKPPSMDRLHEVLAQVTLSKTGVA